MRTRSVLLLLAIVLVAAACSGSDGDTSTAEGSAPDDAPTSEGSSAEDGSDDGSGDGAEAVGVYGEMAHWMCHPDLPDDDNVCLRDLDVTAVAADGTTTVEPHEVAENPQIDCFYVYPTISADLTANSDLEPGEGEEIRAVLNQTARLTGTCEVWAPVYRQFTLGGLMGSIEVDDREAAGEIAYGDVADAWATYLAQSDPDRGVVLIGHSQGSGHLNQLIQNEIDDDPELRDRLVSALLIGSAVAVPPGEDVGGDFDEVPLCRSDDQLGCVVSYASFRATDPPPENSFFGRPRSGDGVAACVNPAALAGGAAELDAVFPAESSPFAEGADGEVTTPFFSMPGLLSGECVSRDGFDYLEVTIAADPADARADDIGGDLTPEWGLHLVDVNLAMGDLATLVASQADAYLARG